MKAVIYLVESSVDGSEQSADIGAQRDACLRYCNEWGIEQREEVIEKGEGGRKPPSEREGLREATQMLGENDQLVVAHRGRVIADDHDDVEELGSMVFQAAASLVSVGEAAKFTPGGVQSVRTSEVFHRIINGGVDLTATFFAVMCFGCCTGMGADQGLVAVSVKGLPFVILAALVCAGFAAMEHQNGKTPGKYIVGTHVRSLDGSDITFGQAMIRNLARLVDFILFGVVGLISILLTDNNQRLGDLLAGTRVLDDV